MKKKIIFLIVPFFFIPVTCAALDFGGLEKQLEEYGVDKVLKSAGLDLDKVTNYLNWDTINISIKADMTSITDSMGRHLRVNSKIYKREVSRIRFDIQGDLNIPRGNTPLTLKDIYVLNYPLKDESFLIAPSRNGYIELEGEKSEELFGKLKQKLKDRDANIEKKEKLGTETIEGYLCDKVHMIMTQKDGTRNDITAWLAQDLQNFPLKAIVDFTTSRNITGRNITEFKNIEKILPDMALFEIPGGFHKYDTLLQLATGSKVGSRVKKRKGKERGLRRR